MLEVVLPIIVGKLLKYFGVFQKEQEKVLINYVMHFALPILAFKEGQQIKLGLEVIKVSSLAWASIVLCMSAAYIIAWLYKLSNTSGEKLPPYLRLPKKAIAYSIAIKVGK